MTRLLTTNEVCAMLGICPDTFRRYRRAGKLPYLRESRLHRRYKSFSSESVELQLHALVGTKSTPKRSEVNSESGTTFSATAV